MVSQSLQEWGEEGDGVRGKGEEGDGWELRIAQEVSAPRNQEHLLSLPRVIKKFVLVKLKFVLVKLAP